AEHALDAAPVTRRRGGALTIARAPARASAPHLCRLQAAQLRAGDRVLMREIDVCVQRDTRLHISGPNGAGKSTLLRAIERAVSLPREQLLVLPQELGEAACRALLERIRALGPGERGQLLALAARLGLAPSRLLDSQLPSPGEARKLCLAEGLSREVALVLLDEPENHLDLPALERLEQCLAEYQGALVLVTHDEALAQTLCDQRLEVSRDTT
ncbi:MAG: ATP-binding cassette domain-containing protein, partial [Myxococcales bacterium]|nr:ATP-binding cassette domain-containing protein [Myxococcales bacterium]